MKQLPAIDYTKERRRTTRRLPRTQQRVTFPPNMPLWERKKYVAIHREINFNAKFGINSHMDDTLRNAAHYMIAARLYELSA